MKKSPVTASSLSIALLFAVVQGVSGECRLALPEQTSSNLTKLEYQEPQDANRIEVSERENGVSHSLESKQISLVTRHQATKDEVNLTVTGLKCSFRSVSRPTFVITSEVGFKEDSAHPVVISRMISVDGRREVGLDDARFRNQIGLIHRSTAHDAVEVSPVLPLDPGEYMLTVVPLDELKEGDSVFLFGVD